MAFHFPARRDPSRSPPTAQAGFTLVELLVVIGIIALLISILLPSLNAAREQANSIKCLSNLRQLSLAMATYTSTHKGTLIPADVQDAKFPVSGLANKQDVNETWATILVGEGYLTYPESKSLTDVPSAGNVFQCPSGILEMSASTFNGSTVPASRTDGQGAMGQSHVSTRMRPDNVVFVWYGINSTNAVTYKTPYRRVNIDANGAMTTINSYHKANEIRKSSEMIALFDGLYGLNYLTSNANRINARHNNKKITNLAFVDGHAESARTKDLPGGDGVAQPSDFLVANLAKYPQYMWRLDQLYQ
ncbi:MAG: hypothetical protein JWO31_1023 [Phycisphaerales bacterium]|nr:hypothetical protein [Phycisphaerales bacterium]